MSEAISKLSLNDAVVTANVTLIKTSGGLITVVGRYRQHQTAMPA